jgi:hypothetical protein
VLADPEPPATSNYLETIVLPPCDPRPISSLPCLVPGERSTKERVPSRQSYDALIKNYHPPTTKGALARHTRRPLPSSLPRPPQRVSAPLFPLSPTLGPLIYLAVVPMKAKQAAAAGFAAEETWQTN